MTPKTCPLCGAVYDAAGWSELPSLGVLHFDRDDDGPEQDLDHRNCRCGDTLVVDLCGNETSPAEKAMLVALSKTYSALGCGV
jgi:hypothetical protein